LFIYGYQNASQNKKTLSFANIAHQNYIHDEIKEQIEFGQCLLLFSPEQMIFPFLSENQKTEMCKTRLISAVL